MLRRTGLDGILLLFIYLELGAMVGIYLKTAHLPVRFLLYIATAALTRRLTIDAKTMLDQHILVITGTIVMLVTAVASLSIVGVKFPVKELRSRSHGKGGRSDNWTHQAVSGRRIRSQTHATRDLRRPDTAVSERQT